MKTSEFVQLLQNEMILPRDPHLADRFSALLEENYEPVEPKEPTPADGVNIVLQEPSVADPTFVPAPVEVLPDSLTIPSTAEEQRSTENSTESEAL